MESSNEAMGSPFDDGDLYDVLLGGAEFGLDYYGDLARRAEGPVLDIGCGTGRVLLPCLAACVDIDGLDLYEPMLARLRTRASELGLSPRLYQGDMSGFRLPRKYALIMIPYNAFTHNVTQESQLRCLAACREHLLPGGLLTLDGAFPGLAWIGAEQNVRVLEGEIQDPRTGRMLRVFDTRSFDRVRQVQHSITEIESIGADGAVELLQRSSYEMRRDGFIKMKWLCCLAVWGSNAGRSGAASMAGS
ncbi:MAG: class I SAM-dependent methyltransferase [Acidobacteria bacterium]|nr:class I SAM-dependent methyltransferase [Acidobacteriota bacterium]